MITVETRWESYEKIKPKMATRCIEILEVLGNKEMTAREIRDAIKKKKASNDEDDDIDMNYVRPRLSDLLIKHHEVVECGEKKDLKTNVKVAIFRRATEQEKMELDNMKHIRG